jgi:hypothetical protein
MSRHISPALIAAILFIPVVAIANGPPRPGSFLKSTRVHNNQDTRESWSPAKLKGWQTLPARTLDVNVDGAHHPLCLTINGSGSRGAGWLGIGLAREIGGKLVMECYSYESSTNSGWIFEQAADKPTPLWVNMSDSQPLPPYPLLVATQGAGRKLYACKFDKNAKRYIGDIGDDKKCYASHNEGGKDTASNYLALVTKDAPAFGWISPADGAKVRSDLATVTLPGVGTKARSSEVQVCRADFQGSKWPGFVINGRCSYLYSSGDQVGSKVATSYEVFHVNTLPARAPYVFAKQGGKSFYACTSAARNANGVVEQVMMGFTHDPALCISSGKTTAAKASATADWSRPEIVALPDEDSPLR